MSRNLLRGSVPDGVRSWEHVLSLKLGENALSGSVPSAVGFLTMIQALSFVMIALTGTLPDALMECSEVMVFQLQENELGGAIPSALQVWTRVARFNKMKTTPAPNKNGSYGKKGGFVCHILGCPYAIFSVEIL